MPLVRPNVGTSYSYGNKNAKIVNPPMDNSDPTGKAGLGATRRQSNVRNTMKIEKPSAGSNTAFKKVGKNSKY